MKRDDDSVFLLWLEPSASEKLSEPVNDELTGLMEMALKKAKTGASNYSKPNEPSRFDVGISFKGTHHTECGQGSSPKDYQLENGMITNSLAPFYLRWYRNSIPQNDFKKLAALKEFYSQTAESKDDSEVTTPNDIFMKGRNATRQPYRWDNQ